MTFHLLFSSHPLVGVALLVVMLVQRVQVEEMVVAMENGWWTFWIRSCCQMLLDHSLSGLNCISVAESHALVYVAEQVEEGEVFRMNVAVGVADDNVDWKDADTFHGVPQVHGDNQ